MDKEKILYSKHIFYTKTVITRYNCGTFISMNVKWQYFSFLKKASGKLNIIQSLRTPFSSILCSMIRRCNQIKYIYVRSAKKERSYLAKKVFDGLHLSYKVNLSNCEL